MILLNDCFMTISGHFFANCKVIFHKTAEVQPAILMHLIGLNSNWFKGYDSKSKYFHFRFLAIL